MGPKLSDTRAFVLGLPTNCPFRQGRTNGIWCQKICMTQNAGRNSSSWRWLFFLPDPHLWHMEAPRLGIESEQQLPTYTTATATPDPSHVCNLQHSHGHAGSLTHWARPGMEPASSWMPVRFISAAPQREPLYPGGEWCQIETQILGKQETLNI